MRSGGDGGVRQSRHAARLDGGGGESVRRAVAHVKIGKVNIARALEILKSAACGPSGLAEDAPKRYDGIDLTLPTALVVGAEGPGCGGWCGTLRLARVASDAGPRFGALNVSVATGVALFEAADQRGTGRLTVR